MTNVEVPRGFGWETRNDLAFLCILEAKSEPCGRFIRSGFIGFSCCEARQRSLDGLETLYVRYPPKKMNILLPILEKPDKFWCNL